jgi:macrolide-specific efflux system membrane fusion protein
MQFAAAAARAKRYRVTVVQPDGSLQRRPVVIGVMSRVTAQVLAGLSPGDKVVVGIRSGNKPAARNASGRNGRSGYGGGPRLGGYR